MIDSHKILSDVGQPFNDANQIAHDAYDCSACNLQQKGAFILKICVFEDMHYKKWFEGKGFL